MILETPEETAEDTGRRALVVGSGYLGTRVAKLLAGERYMVLATCRSERRLSELSELEDRRIDARRLDLEDCESNNLWKERYQVVVYCVAAGRRGDPRLAYVDGPRKVLDCLRERPPDRFIFTSSTGVHAQSDGSDVDEESPALAREGSPRWILEGEELVRHRGGTVLRLGGLYGPGRSPLDWLRREDFRGRLDGSSAAFLNWIHVDDAASAVTRAVQAGRPGETYLVVDGNPVRRGDFYSLAARLTGVEAPALGDDPTDRGKKCRNDKMLRELGVVLRYPSYREGLESLAACGGADGR